MCNIMRPMNGENPPIAHRKWLDNGICVDEPQKAIDLLREEYVNGWIMESAWMNLSIHAPTIRGKSPGT